MRIEFSNKKLLKICSSAKESQAKHGKRMAEKIQLRMAQLAAVETLLFSPDHEPLPVKVDGGLKLEEVTAVLIEGIGDYHGK